MNRRPGPGVGPFREDHMKNVRIILAVVVLVAALLTVGGCSRHYVDLYINDDCVLVQLDNDVVINPLVVFEGDYVMFISLREKAVTISLDPAMFDTGTIELAPGASAVVKVIGDPEMEGAISLSGDGCPSVPPKVVIGEGP